LGGPEISGSESLLVTFSEPVVLANALITNLFSSCLYSETGAYRLSSGASSSFTAGAGKAANGQLVVGVNALTTSIRFFSPLPFSSFSVGGISFNRAAAVPELDPKGGMTALALVAAGLLVVMSRRRSIGLAAGG
jgi:uncharacterized protein (TIGR03382 family)